MTSRAFHDLELGLVGHGKGACSSVQCRNCGYEVGQIFSGFFGCLVTFFLLLFACPPAIPRFSNRFGSMEPVGIELGIAFGGWGRVTRLPIFLRADHLSRSVHSGMQIAISTGSFRIFSITRSSAWKGGLPTKCRWARGTGSPNRM